MLQIVPLRVNVYRSHEQTKKIMLERESLFSKHWFCALAVHMCVNVM